MGLDADALTMTQGIAGSGAAMAIGNDQAERIRRIVLQLDEQQAIDLGAALRPD